MKVDILDTEAKLVDFFGNIVKNSTSEIFALDTETDSVIEKTAKLFGVGLALSPEQAYYIPIRHNTGDPVFSEALEVRIARGLNKLASTKLMVGHNIIYDMAILKNNMNIELTDRIYADTILMKHCIAEEPPFGLKDIAVHYLGPWADKAQKALYDNIAKNGGSTTKSNLQMWKADTEVLGEYCGYDVMLTYQLFEKFYPMLEEQNLLELFFETEIMPLYKECVIPMKDKGFPINVEHFLKLKETIQKDLDLLEESIQEEIAPLVAEYVTDVLNTTFPVKPGGTLAKMLAYELDMPHTMAKLRKQVYTNTNQSKFQEWILSRGNLPSELERFVVPTQMKLWMSRFPEDKYVFSIGSRAQLSWLFFDKLKIPVTETTPTGTPKLSAGDLTALAEKYSFCSKLVEYRQLIKLKGTYIEGMLDRHIDGRIYTSFLMFGTTSGRFSSTSPNIQNLPRIKDEESKLAPLILKYANAIKEGFVSPPGYKIVNADYSQLEPRAFAEASGDKILQQSFKDEEDLYGSIAKNIWKLSCTANEVKKLHPELRQKAKAVALAVVYGAEAGRIAQVLKCDWKEANGIIQDYINTYPGLKTYMNSCDKEAATKGFIYNKFGKVRHLPEAKEMYQRYGNKLLDRRWAKANNLMDERYAYKSLLNNAKNFPIQSTAAHIVNRAMIQVCRDFKENNIDGYIAGTCHDELTCIVREDQAEEASVILKNAMENTTKLNVPLKTEPVIGNNWAESK